MHETRRDARERVRGALGRVRRALGTVRELTRRAAGAVRGALEALRARLRARTGAAGADTRGGRCARLLAATGRPWRGILTPRPGTAAGVQLHTAPAVRLLEGATARGTSAPGDRCARRDRAGEHGARGTAAGGRDRAGRGAGELVTGTAAGGRSDRGTGHPGWLHTPTVDPCTFEVDPSTAPATRPTPWRLNPVQPPGARGNRQVRDGAGAGASA